MATERILIIDEAQPRVWLGKKQIQFSAREFRRLAQLAKKEGEVVLLKQILQRTHAIEGDTVESWVSIEANDSGDQAKAWLQGRRNGLYRKCTWCWLPVDRARG